MYIEHTKCNIKLHCAHSLHALFLLSLRTFQEVLHDPAHLKCFREFLSKQGEDQCTPLTFWHTVDTLKKQIGLQQDGGLTLEEIHRTYFTMNADKSQYTF